MTLGTTQSDNASNPVSSVYVPGTANSDLTALEGYGPINTDANSQKSAPASMGIKDGNDATMGAKADTAATSDTGTFSLIALFKRLLQKMTSLVTNTNAFLDTSASGTISTLDSNVSITLPGGQATALVQITGTFVGTLNFEGSPDGGTTWYAVMGSQAGTSTSATSATTTGVWRLGIAGYTNFRVRLNPATSGSATVLIRLTQGTHNVFINNAATLGQNTMANSTSVTMASNQSAIPSDGAALQGPVNITTAGGSSGGTSPTFTGTCTASADNSVTFASKVRTIQMHNQSAVNVSYEHDITAAATSPYLAPGQLVYIDVHTTTLHVFPPNALPINAASGLIVRGWT